MSISKVANILRTNRLTRSFYPQIKGVYYKHSLARNIRLLQANGWATLAMLHSLFSDAEILYFADFGTLLGIVRGGGFLAHDSDIDLGVLHVNSEKVFNLMEKNGFRLKKRYLYKGKAVLDQYLVNRIKVDICYYECDGNVSKCWLFYYDPKKINVYPNKQAWSAYEFSYSLISSVKTIKCNGYDVNVPAQEEHVLVEKYGENWRTPDKGWAYWESPGAVECEEYGQLVFK